MKCWHCENEVTETVNGYCPHCGRRLKISTEPSSEKAPDPAPASTPESVPTPSATKSRNKKKSSGMLPVCIIAVIAVLILLVRQSIFPERQIMDTRTVEVDTITAETMVGDHVQYGSYEQDNNLKNGKEPIDWIVLDEDNKRYLLISSKLLDAACYNNVWMETGWKTCSLRNWLNESFLEEAFTEEQKDNISKWHSSLDDKVFILSKKELNAYLPDQEDRAVEATPYAEARGVFVHDNGKAWWWVRNAGSSEYYAAYVNCLGDLIGNGILVFNDTFGVRPVIWVYK